MQVIKIFHRKVTAPQAQELFVKHHKAFSQSACTKCPGICCKDCADSDGYLYRDDVSEEAIEELKVSFGWSSVSGFKSEKGCRLPLHLRSTTCVSFYCEQLHLNNKFGDEVLKERRSVVGPIAGLDVFGVAQEVSELRELMENIFD